MEDIYYKHCLNLRRDNKFRMLKDIIKTNEIVDFSSNDYLGLSVSQEVIEASSIAGEKYGVGATGSRILSGNFEIFKELEGKIAKDKNEESSLIFNTGFQANISVIAALLDKKILGKTPLVFFDRLNHSSMYNGVFLSGAKLVRYRHNDMDHLQKLLEDYNSDDSPKFIMSETVFGMDGDVVCMNSLVDISKKHNAFLYLDKKGELEWLTQCAYDVSIAWQTKKDFNKLIDMIIGNKKLIKVAESIQKLMAA